jgi:hypothetical protein
LSIENISKAQFIEVKFPGALAAAGLARRQLEDLESAERVTATVV